MTFGRLLELSAVENARILEKIFIFMKREL